MVQGPSDASGTVCHCKSHRCELYTHCITNHRHHGHSELGPLPNNRWKSNEGDNKAGSVHQVEHDQVFRQPLRLTFNVWRYGQERDKALGKVHALVISNVLHEPRGRLAPIQAWPNPDMSPVLAPDLSKSAKPDHSKPSTPVFKGGGIDVVEAGEDWTGSIPSLRALARSWRRRLRNE